jgi:hypothetical protein
MLSGDRAALLGTPRLEGEASYRIFTWKIGK